MKLVQSFAVCIVGAALSFTACNESPKNSPETAPAAPAATTPIPDMSAVKMDTGVKTMLVAGKYYCPMDKDVVSDKPGKCPKCGMDLVEAGKEGAMKKMEDMKKTDKMGDKKMEKH